jgi:hypothetical protein
MHLSYPAVAATGSGSYMGVFETTAGCPNQYCTKLGGAIMGTYAGQQASYKGTYVGAKERSPDIAFDGTNHTSVYAHVVGCGSYLGAVRINTGGLPSSSVHMQSWPGVNDAAVAFGSTNGLVAFTLYHENSASPGNGYYSVHAVRASTS